MIHDWVDFQHPKESMEMWIQVITEDLESKCHNSISMNVSYVGPETDLNKDLVNGKSNEKVS